MSGISTHVLDIAAGRPAAAVPVALERNTDGDWRRMASATTDADGRVPQLLPANVSLSKGIYKIVFNTGSYFEAQDLQGLYPLVEIAFIVRDEAGHYHIPLLLSANGYSTYRGS